MALLDNILSALDHWGEWKKIREAPTKVELLEKRIAKLEERLKKRPFDECPKCHALDFRMQSSEPYGPSRTRQLRRMRCEECGFEETLTV